MLFDTLAMLVILQAIDSLMCPMYSQMSIHTTHQGTYMSRVDEILAKQKALAEELDLAKQEERDEVLKDIKAKIKMFDFKASDFKGLLKSRVTQSQVDAFNAKKATAAKKTAAKKTAK